MPKPHLDVHAELPADLVQGLAAIRTELAIPADFSPEVTAAAIAAAANSRLPELDLTDLAFESIDPPGARDLDQALFIERDGAGFRVWYAIADVAAFVTAGDPIDAETHRRGNTLYAPDQRTPLHPPELSEGAASLLADQVRPALVWDLRVQPDGRCEQAEVTRALVRNRAQHSYDDVQAALADGSASPSLQLLAEVGPRREQIERDRGGVSLPVPEQEVDTTGDQGWTLRFRAPLPVEGWNAQISLMTGMAAATIMLDGKIGVLRTLPPADQGSLRRLRQTAKALKISWPTELAYPEFVRSLDPADPRHAAMLNACTRLFRGAGYQSFSGEVPTDVQHSALATEYAHCTAPLRRLVDRYALEICVALSAKTPVPDWVIHALDALPDEQTDAARLDGKYERAVLDLIEAHLLQPRVGERFRGVVIEVDEKRHSGQLVVEESAVEAKITGAELPLGEEVEATLTDADPAQRLVRFALTA